MRKITGSSIFHTTATGYCVGASIGISLSWALLVANPIISHWVADGPDPASACLALGGCLASLFAVGAALSAFIIQILYGGDAKR